jgi:putative Holliday junction resolvase
MRVMGLDVGTKTVGVAISDALGYTAQGITVVRRTHLRADLEALAKLVESHDVTLAVIGLPLNMDGSEGPRAQASREFAEKFTAATGVPVEMWDERLSTVAAQRVLLEGDVSRAKRKQVVDQVAASIILQGWMDARPSQAPEEPWDDDPEPA